MGNSAITLTPAEPIPGYFQGLSLRFLAAAANAGAATVTITGSGFTALPLLRRDGTALQAGDIRAGDLCTIVFEGTNFRLLDISGVPPAFSLNYWGDGSDGALSTTGDVLLPSTTDGDMVVRNYTSLTINAGHTFTTQNRCRGLLIYVAGDCTINGTLSMTARGAAADPTASGSSDGNPVNSGGITFWRRTLSGSAAFVSNGTFGCGTAAVTAEANQASSSGNATLFTVARAGAAGGATQAGATPVTAGNAGSNGSSGQSGGGGSGAGSGDINAIGTGGAGAAGTCFSGGGGGGAGSNAGGLNAGTNGLPAAANGGAGGDAGTPTGANRAMSGGAGNPAGANSVTAGSVTGVGTGTGGLLILVVRGNLTIGGSGVIAANGVQTGSANGASVDNVSGGSSGGGNVVVLYGDTLTNSGSIQANGGSAASASGGSVNAAGGAGGNGSVQGPTQILV